MDVCDVCEHNHKLIMLNATLELRAVLSMIIICLFKKFGCIGQDNKQFNKIDEAVSRILVFGDLYFKWR